MANEVRWALGHLSCSSPSFSSRLAAGVLINTAGFLQSQAEQTGEESTAQVANNLQVISSVGTVTEDTDGTRGVQSIEVSVKLSPGSDPIALDDATIEVYPEGASSTTNPSVTISGDTQLSDSSNEATIAFDNNDVFGSYGSDPTNGLEAGNEAEILIVTADGSQTTQIISAPDPITSGEVGGDVRL
ncbi:MAG: flagellin [Natronomonas sp.]